MPWKPKRPCGYPSCPKLVTGQYCEEHKKLADKHYNRYQRDSFSKTFYNSKAWRGLAREQLRREPLCVECLKVKRVQRAEIADHIKPIRDGGVKLDRDNLQSLCKACHNRKHG